MRLLGRKRLGHLRGRGEQFEKWVRSWVAEVMAAHWKRPSDVSEQFPNARDQGEGRFMFHMGECQWAICLFIAFPQGVALITDLKVEDETHGT